jgi:hypothetical protein
MLNIQGWITVFSWSALVCIAPYFIGTQIQGMIVLADPTYELVRWRGTLLMWAVAIIPIIINIFARRVLGGIEVAAGIMHVVFLPVTIAVFVILAPRNPNFFVWDTFVEGLSGWQNSGVVFSIGLLGVITPLAGMLVPPLLDGFFIYSTLGRFLYCSSSITISPPSHDSSTIRVSIN